MPLGFFMCLRTGNKLVKFHVKIPSGCLENGKQLEGILFLPHTVISSVTDYRNANKRADKLTRPISYLGASIYTADYLIHNT